ncbi:MAG: sulfatase-like hydrolase/transferase [Prevotella sp.]|nr:sulfatase-like hydrolase/transferase [Prevotella sp.]
MNSKTTQASSQWSQRLFRLPLVAVVWDLLLAYLVYFMARVAFVLENWSLFSQDMTSGYLMELMRGGLLFDTSAILYTNVLWVVMVLLPLHLKENRIWMRICKWVFIVINTLALALNLCDAVYFPFSMRRTTTTVFHEFQNESNLGSIFLHEAVAHWYFFLLAALVVWALWRLYRQPTTPTKPRLRYYLLMLLSLLIFAPFCIAGMRGGWTRQVRPITISNANAYCKRPTDVGIVLNTPFSLLRTIGKNNFEVPDYYQQNELETIYSPLHMPADSVVMKRKNVVVLIVESFGREYIGALNTTLENGNYRGYTPFADSLIARSATFSHSYCNGRKSIDGMPSILSAIPMFVEPFFLSPYSVNDLSGLAGCLGHKGYATAFFHGAARGSMGFLAFARTTGFADYFGREDYEAETPQKGNDYGVWGIDDEPFLQYFCRKMTTMKEPFMTALFTLSSHHPFVVPEAYRDVYKEEGLPIHKVIRYTDHALQLFFEEAQRQPWFRNTIFVLTSDHTNQSDHPEYQTDLGGFSSPIIIYDPSGEIAPGMREAIAQQTDIMPTILAHLGYDEPYVAFGVDLLNTPADSTWAVNYTNGIYQYVKYGHIMQFDGKKTTAVYSLADSLMTHNLVGKVSQQAQMERELKAIIQQYMERMTQNRLIASPQ